MDLCRQPNSKSSNLLIMLLLPSYVFQYLGIPASMNKAALLGMNLHRSGEDKYYFWHLVLIFIIFPSISPLLTNQYYSMQLFIVLDLYNFIYVLFYFIFTIFSSQLRHFTLFNTVLFVILF